MHKYSPLLMLAFFIITAWPTYYQPVLFNLGDYRLLKQRSLKVKAGKKIAVSINWNYQYDASPAAGIVTDTYKFSTGIEVDL